MSAFDDFQECIDGLSAKKIATRRDSIDKLINLIKTKEIVTVLHSNFRKPNRIQWSSVFDLVFECLKDFEKLDAKNKQKTRMISSCNETLETIIETACFSGKLDICSSYIVSNLILHLSESSIVSTTSINLLQKIIDIPSARYGMTITHWKELYNICKKLLNDKFSKNLPIANTNDVVRLFKKICQHCPPVAIRGCPTFLTSIWSVEGFITNMTNQNKQDFLEITYLVSKKLLVDCRRSICKMGEQILPKLLMLYEKRSEELGGIKSLIFDNCLIQMTAHHPRGALKGSTLTFVATTWLDWEKIVDKIYFILNDEAVTVSKSIKYKLASSNEIWENYSRLFVEILHQKLFYSLNESRNDGPSVKKIRYTNVIDLIVEKINEEITQPWLVVLTKFFMTYPKDLTSSQLDSVLGELLKCKCATTIDRFNRSQCFLAILNADEEFHLDSWKIVWDITTRSIGNRENIDVSNEIFQRLIVRNIFDATPIVRVFNSCQSPSIELLRTFAILFRHEFLVNSNETIDEKEKIWGWLSSENLVDSKEMSTIFRSNLTTRLLAGLVLREFPEIDLVHEKIVNEFDNDITWLIQTQFDEEVVEDKRVKHWEYRRDEDMFEKYNKLISKFVENNDKISSCHNVVNLSAIFDRLIFSLNLLSAYVDFEIISDVDSCVLTSFIDKSMGILANILSDLSLDDKIFVIDFFKQLAHVYSLNVNVVVQQYLRKIASRDFLQAIFSVLHTVESQDLTSNEYQSVVSSGKWRQNLSYLVMEVLCNFIFVSHSKELSQVQRGCLKTILNSIVANSDNLKMKLIVVNYLTSSWLGSLKTIFIKNALNVLEICTSEACRSQLCCDTVENLMKIIKRLVGHVFIVQDPELELNFLKFFADFLKTKYCYPNLLVVLLHCIDTVIQVTDLSQDDDVRKVIFKFLKVAIESPYQSVRLCWIDVVGSIFKTGRISRGDKNELFDTFESQIQRLFEVSESLVKDNKDDEVVCRTSSVLRYYVTIVLNEMNFQVDALFSILVLTRKNGISLDLIQRVLNQISKKLNCTNVNDLFNPHMEFLLCKWQVNNKIVDFPYPLLNCGSEVDFLTRYINHIFLICFDSGDMKQLETLSETCGRDASELLKTNFSKLYAQIFPLEFEVFNESNMDVSLRRKLHHIQTSLTKYLNQTEINELFRHEIHTVFLESIQLLDDPIDFLVKFGVKYEKKSSRSLAFNLNVLNKIKHKIEIEIQSESLVKSLAIESPNKIEIILRELSNCLFKSSSENDTLKALHHYAYFSDEIVANFRHVENLIVFLMRYITYTLIYLIEANKSVVVTNAAARYLKIFCSACTEKNQFKSILNNLINLIVPQVAHSVDLIDLLETLIIEHSSTYSDLITKLDPFPNDSKFGPIQAKYNEIRTKNIQNGSRLKQEIDHFLNVDGCFENISRLEGLKRLSQELSTRKSELKLLYDELKEKNGLFDADDCILHRLIKLLVELSTCCDENLSIEAAKCLGELGPSDLTTFILHVDKVNITDYYGEDMRLLIVGCLLEKMIELQVDPSVTTREHVSHILYSILQNSIGHCTLCEDHINIKYSRGCLLTDYLVPFISKNDAVNTENLKILGEQFKKLQDVSLWWPGGDTLSHHATWIKNLVVEIIKSFVSPQFFQLLIPLIHEKVDFAEFLFPLLIELLLSQRSIANKCSFLSDQVGKFLQRFWDGDKVHRSSLKVVLDLIHLNKFRTQRNRPNKTKEFLNVNYLHVAKATQRCGAYLSTIFYAELWCCGFTVGSERKWGNTMLDRISEISMDDAVAVRNILREAYINIGDKDAINGCDSVHLIHLENRAEYYEMNGLWSQALLHHDLLLANRKLQQQNKSFIPIMKTLKTSGLYHLADVYTKYQNLSDDYDCAWRLQNWSLIDRETQTTSSKAINKDHFENYHYFALKSLSENESPRQYLHLSRQCIIESFRNESLESTNNLYTALSKLQMVQEIDDFSNILLSENVALENIVSKWNAQLTIDSNDFTLIEPILKQRICLVQILLRKSNQDESIWNLLAKLQIDSAEFAHENNYVQVAKNFLFEIPMHRISRDMQHAVKFVEAKLEYSLDGKIGRSLLQQLLNMENCCDYKLRLKVFQTYGKWMMETRSENPDKYFQRALDILNDLNSPNDSNYVSRYEAYDAIARFADGEYQQVRNFLKSPAYESKIKCIERSNTIYTELSQRYQNVDPLCIPKDDRRIMIYNQKCATMDKVEISNIKEDLDKNLEIAMKYYLLSLANCDDYNLRVYRVVALWFENKSHESLDKLLNDNLSSIPVYKFLPILAQIAPHISTNSNSFTEKICNLIERCTVEHPHHALPVLLALALTNKHERYDGRERSGEKISQPRVVQAQRMLKSLHRNSQIKDVLDEMIQVYDALIRLAYLPISSDHTIPPEHSVCRLKKLNHILVPTLDLPVRPSGNYTEIIRVHKWKERYTPVGGINAPKKIICVGSNGVEYPQLIKGEDDLRQDAVMQQVFSIMNTLLNRSDCRNLLIRTYKVVPLSQKSGLLEWCSNTMPLFQYLVGNPATPGVHQRYYPEDLTPHDCRLKMHEAKTLSNEAKLKAFQEICERFRPAFHHFFWEHWGNAAIWWSRRRSYTLSVAVTSIVGYILGIGDRHLSNILIDCSTAQLIHIDFGIAFEQGKILPTPETVPFRLTRDIEDGMGVLGVEGVFRRSCEKTMKILRNNSEIILTILEVLLYDPLYMWAITPSKAVDIQRGLKDETDAPQTSITDEEVNQSAKRALLRLTQKLQGSEEGRVTSIEGQVERLLQQARDPVNLCRLFSGWQPYL